jgi:peptide/nickel transport system substrate-binding protein
VAQAPATRRVGLAEDPAVLDPTLARSFVGRIVFAGLCDKLVDIGEQLAITPRRSGAAPCRPRWPALGR